MRALVTGGNGFAGSYLSSMLEAFGHTVFPTVGPREHVGGIKLQLLDASSIDAALLEAKPDAIFHLAGQASVPASRKDPQEAFNVNATGTLMVLEHIARARRMGLAYVYLGYWVRGSDKMDYKVRFSPLEALGQNGWEELSV